jgi:DNA-binding response OmpR family regulator
MKDKRILVVDDNEDVLKIVQEVLKYKEFEVKAITKAVKTREFGPHLVLIDFKLSDGNGGELCRFFKSQPEFRGIPVIIFTAYYGLDLDRYGCDAVISKPFDLEELSATVSIFFTSFSQNLLLCVILLTTTDDIITIDKTICYVFVNSHRKCNWRLLFIIFDE